MTNVFFHYTESHRSPKDIIWSLTEPHRSDFLWKIQNSSFKTLGVAKLATFFLVLKAQDRWRRQIFWKFCLIFSVFLRLAEVWSNYFRRKHLRWFFAQLLIAIKKINKQLTTPIQKKVKGAFLWKFQNSTKLIFESHRTPQKSTRPINESHRTPQKWQIFLFTILSPTEHHRSQPDLLISPTEPHRSQQDLLMSPTEHHRSGKNFFFQYWVPQNTTEVNQTY